MEPTITTIITALGSIAIVLGPAYLVLRGQLEKIRADARAETARLKAEAQKAAIEAAAAKREDDRKDFDAVVDEQATTIKRQASTIVRLEGRIEKVEGELRTERDGRIDLQRDVSQLKMILQLMRRAVLTECGKDDCPLWRYLDDRERDGLFASLLSKEPVASKDGKDGKNG